MPVSHRQGRAVPARPFFSGRHFEPAGTWFASLAPRSPLSVAGCAATGHSIFIPQHSPAPASPCARLPASAVRSVDASRLRWRGQPRHLRSPLPARCFAPWPVPSSSPSGIDPFLVSSLPFDTCVSAPGTPIECTGRSSDRYLRSFPLHSRPLIRRGGSRLPFSPASIPPSLAPRDFPSLTAPRRFLSHTRRIVDAWRAMAGHACHCPHYSDIPHTPAQVCRAGNSCHRSVAPRMPSAYGVNMLNSWGFRNRRILMAYAGL